MQQQSSDEDDENNEEDGNQATGKSEQAEASNPVAQNAPIVEVGQETNSEELLNKYLILHCAKLHLSVTDASSGEYIPRKQARVSGDLLKSTSRT